MSNNERRKKRQKNCIDNYESVNKMRRVMAWKGDLASIRVPHTQVCRDVGIESSQTFSNFLVFLGEPDSDVYNAINKRIAYYKELADNHGYDFKKDWYKEYN